MARRRAPLAFSLSYLDVMASGLGAVALVYLIINHAVEVRATDAQRDWATRVARLEEQVLTKRDAAAALAASLRAAREDTRAAQARSASLLEKLGADPQAGAELRERGQRVAVLEEELRAMEAEVRRLREQAVEAEATRRYVGEGDRQYLTGLKIGGRHVLILVDASASMLDEKIVDIVRRRNMDASRKIASPKWQRALNTVDWITTQVPVDARFQIYTFNIQSRPVLPDTADQWLDTDSGQRLTAAVRALRDVVPDEGTSLYRAFAAAGRLRPQPDNIYLVTDGLPTQGETPGRTGAVSGEERVRLFRDALKVLPRGAPVNVILLPMEGDPMAASAFWHLARITGGSFLSPSRDWP